MTLDLQWCTRCDHVQYYPRATCTRCSSTDLRLAPACGTGRLYSFTVVHRALREDIDVPYVVAVVRLDEGPSMLTHIVDCPLDQLHCDAAVELRWRPFAAGEPLPVFTLRLPRSPTPSRRD